MTIWQSSSNKVVQDFFHKEVHFIPNTMTTIFCLYIFTFSIYLLLSWIRKIKMCKIVNKQDSWWHLLLLLHIQIMHYLKKKKKSFLGCGSFTCYIPYSYYKPVFLFLFSYNQVLVIFLDRILLLINLYIIYREAAITAS